LIGFSGGNLRNQNGYGMGGRSNFMDQSGGGMNRYPDSGSRDFNRPGNASQFPGGSRSERRPDFESLPPPPSKYFNHLMFYELTLILLLI